MAKFPTLELIIEKGPRAGETLTFLPTNPPVRIGRVARGNSVSIKDSGVSTKHLTIEFKTGKWLITDVGSSNGTVLNSQVLQTLSPKALSDGDHVKIGEVTVIKIRIGISDVLIGSPSQKGELAAGAIGLAKMEVRRRPRRGKAVVEEGLRDVENMDNDMDVKKPRTRREKAMEKETRNLDDMELGIHEKLAEVKKKRGRPKRKELVENFGKEDEMGDVVALGLGRDLVKKPRSGLKEENVDAIEPIQGRQISPRRTRSNKNENNSIVVAAEVLDKKTRGGGKRRGKATAFEVAKSSPVKVGPQFSTRRTRRGKIDEGSGLRVIEDREKEDANDSRVCSEVTKRGKKRKDRNELKESGEGDFNRKGNVATVQSGNGLSSEMAAGKSESRQDFHEVENCDNVKRLRTSTEERQEGVENGPEDGEALELEKITLAQWFDYLDVYLHKSIYDKTEEILLEMHQKAERFQDFVQELEKDKGKGKLPVE